MLFRDLKAGNVLMSDDGLPILMDFGSAAQARLTINASSEAQALQDEAAEHCSMCFRPPELFSIRLGQEIDERTDIWVKV